MSTIGGDWRNLNRSASRLFKTITGSSDRNSRERECVETQAPKSWPVFRKQLRLVLQAIAHLMETCHHAMETVSEPHTQHAIMTPNSVTRRRILRRICELRLEHGAVSVQRRHLTERYRLP
jgi:hypothetical protein